MIRGFLTGIAAVVCSVIIYLILHLGLFRSVMIQEEVRPPMYVLYADHRGAYYKMADVIAKVEQLAKVNHLPCTQTFGEYFDNPNDIEEDRLRSRGGCVSQTPYAEPAPEGLQTDRIPDQRYVAAQFFGSPAIGPWKVYPKVHAYMDEHRLHVQDEAIEVYTVNGDQISTEYLFPLK